MIRQSLLFHLLNQGAAIVTVAQFLRLLFQIEGLLQMDPAPEQVSFDTTLQLSSGEYQIRGERSA